MAERTRLCDLLTVLPKQQQIFCFDVALKAGGGDFMTIAALVLILLLQFGVGFVLNRLEAERRSRRFG